VTGIVLGAAYMLWLYQRTMFGEITKEENKTLPDLDAREMATLIPIVALCFWIGLYPAPFLKAMEASVVNVIQTVEKGAAGKQVGAKQASESGNPATREPGKRGTGEAATRQFVEQSIGQLEPADRPALADHSTTRPIDYSTSMLVADLGSRLSALGSQVAR
jgi:hypothetical protein